MKTEEELIKITNDLEDWLYTKDLTTWEALRILDTLKFGFQFEAWERSKH